MGTNRCRGSFVALLLGLAVATSAASSAQVPKLLLNSPPDEIPGAAWRVQELTRAGTRIVFADEFGGAFYAFDPQTGQTSLLFDPAESNGFFQGSLLAGGDEDLFVRYPAAEARPLGGTDGTPTGSRLMPESAFPGVSFGLPASLDPRQQAKNDHVVLSAFETGELEAFWASDATREGTFRISTPLPAAEASLCESAPLASGLLLPVARIAGTTELWWSDGTPSGSHLLASVPYEFSEGRPFAFASRALYACANGTGQRGLCSTDGTVSGTEFFDVELSSDYLGSGTIAYFRGLQNGTFNLWRSDGTSAGTFALDAPGTPHIPSFPDEVSAAVPRGLVFRVLPDSAPAEIWIIPTDGITAEKLATPCDDQEGCEELPSNHVWQLENLALFFAFERERGTWLWSTDGTLEGTVPVLDMNGVVSRGYTIEEDGRWYALGETPELGEELYVSDGTPVGSLRLTDFTEPAAFTAGGSYAPEVATLDGRVWFAAYEPGAGRQLFSATPRLSGAVQETHWVWPSGGALGRIGGRQGMFAIERPCGYRAESGLWSSDGTPERTARVLESDPWTCGGFPLLTTGTPFTWGASLAVPWRDSTHHHQLFWIGEPAQEPVAVTAFAEADVHNAAQVGSAAVYQVHRQDGSFELWASDTPDSPARFLANLPANTQAATRLQPVSTLALFATSTLGGHCEVWRTDATASGTYALGISATGFFCPDPFSLTVTQAGKRGFFILIDADHFGAIWETDGTVANTRQFTAPNLRVLRFLQPALIDGRIVFAADEDGRPSGLYAQTPDSAAALRLTDLAPVRPSGTGGYPTLAAATSSRVFVTGFDAEHGQELWSADGSGGPFTRLRDIAPGSRSSHPENLTVVDGRLLFSANDDVHGRELWISDGTSAGTRMIWEVAQGGFSSFPSSLTAIGTDLVFSAFHPLIGQEVWILHLGTEAPGLIFDDNFESGSTAQWERSPD